MPFSEQLKKYLRKGTFPLLSSDGRPLIAELIRALEQNAAAATAEAKQLLHSVDETYFDNNFYVNDVEVTVGLNDIALFVGALHEHLTSDFAVATSSQTPIPDYIQRVRAVARSNNLVQESAVTLGPQDPNHQMGTGLTTTGHLTYLPDPSLYGANCYGSVPDQKAIGSHAPAWEVLKRRRYVNPFTGAVGAKPHYVLAHLINHNINGSGSDPKNVVPFWATGNTDMAKKVESHLKVFVQQGVPTSYLIVLGPPVGMTADRQTALANCTTALEREIIELEQHLPQYLTLTLMALNDQNQWVTIVNNERIDNYVPETVPVT